MFRIVSIIAFLVTFAGITVHRIAFPSGPGEHRRRVGILKKLVYLLTLLFLEQRLSLLGKSKKLLYLLAVVCFLVLGVAGFYPALVLGEELSGYLLMIHVTAGGVFAVCLAILALTSAHHYRFNENDWPWLGSLVRREARTNKFIPDNSELLRKAAFWLLVIAALPLMLSVVLSMFPIFGTAGQYFLADTHRYATLVFALVAIVHTYLIIQARVRE